MNETLPNAQSLNQTIGIDFGWVANPYVTPYGYADLANTDFSTPLGPIDDVSSPSFADAMSSFMYQKPADPKHGSAAITTIDPMNMWPGPDPSTSPSIASRRDSAYSSSGTPKTAQTELTTYSAPDTPKPAQLESPQPPLEGPDSFPTESGTTCRARYAANQRHRKARDLKQASNNNLNSSTSTTHPTPTSKADERKCQLREKNKVAAAKCRQRQRRQAETVRAKGARLSEDNAQLKSCVQQLRQQLNVLRAYALGHGDCDARLAAYNRTQADRVLAEYCSSYSGMAGGGRRVGSIGSVGSGIAMPLEPKDKPLS